MNTSPKWMKISGLVCHILVGGFMLVACGMKATGMMPADALKEMAKYGIADKIQMIGIGGVISAILMLVPRTSLLGSMAVSSYWGGAILLHMSHDEPYIVQSILVVLTWAGALLRHPETMLNRK